MTDEEKEAEAKAAEEKAATKKADDEAKAEAKRLADEEKAAFKKAKKVRVICDGFLGPERLVKGDVTALPEYVALLDDERNLVELAT